MRASGQRAVALLGSHALFLPTIEQSGTTRERKTGLGQP